MVEVEFAIGSVVVVVDIMSGEVNCYVTSYAIGSILSRSISTAFLLRLYLP